MKSFDYSNDIGYNTKMYLFYNSILIILLIILSPGWIIALIAVKKFRAGFFQKCGFLNAEIIDKLSKFNVQPIWFHAVSVGECLAIVDLIKQFSVAHPEIPIVISTVTYTGQQIARKQLSDIATIIYFPFDIGFISNRVINIVNPQLVAIVETEIWPNFSYILSSKQIPLILINGRLSPKSFKNYYNFRFFTAKVLSFYTKFLMQSEMDAERIVKIGADKAKVEVTGNIKYDIKRKLSDSDIDNIKKDLNLKLDDKVIIAGSTHSTEEAGVLSVFQELSKEVDNLKLILVPRHPERYPEVMQLLNEKETSYGLRSKKNTFSDAPILLLDTMGELSSFYSIATVAFVGGSLIPKGGHNPIEPALYNVPVLMGEHIFNFLDICNYMIESKSLLLVKNDKELISLFRLLLTDSNMYKQMQKACYNMFQRNNSATDLILNYLDQTIKK